MTDATSDEMSGRTRLARTAITALNLIAPGLGLLRLGNWRAAVIFLLAPFAMLPLLTFGMGHLPLTSYGRVVFALVMAIGLWGAVYVASALLTWRKSRFRSPAHLWSRWYGILAVAIVVLAASQFAPTLMHQFYKPFFAPSESMAPTIGKGDKFIADMRWRGPVRHGEIVIFKGPDGVRVSRIAAIPGDRIAMRDGVLVLNGHSVFQSPAGKTAFASYDGMRSAAMLTEQLPGETSAHRVLDRGHSEFDDTQEVVVPSNHVFLLGDNRDSSADSRVPLELGGVGIVPLGAILGRPMYIHWSADRSKIDMRLDK